MVRFGNINTREVMFDTVPPGTYSVRYSFAGSWSGYQNVTTIAGNLSTIYAVVAGDPTPQPAEKPICTSPVALPSSSGNAPLEVNLYIGYTGNSTYTTSEKLRYIQWDFTGDGSWDTTTNYGNPSQYTYQSAGAYTVKGRIQAENGDYSDPCQTTISVY